MPRSGMAAYRCGFAKQTGHGRGIYYEPVCLPKALCAKLVLSEGRHHAFSYALKKSSLEIPDCVQIVLRVEAFIRG